MAITSIGTLGQATNGVSSTTLSWTTTTSDLSASGDLAILSIVSDNLTTTDGATNDHSSVTGGNGTWTKLGEYTNGEGSAAAGVTTSQWLFRSTGANTIGTVFTITFSAAVVDKCAAGWKFTVAAGNSLQAGASIIGNATDASNGFGSAAHSGLSSLSRLYIRSMGKEANTTTAITVSTSFTRFTATARSRNNVDAVCTASEFRINTSTGETSNPTLAVSGDTAAVFSALEEYTPAGSGAIAGTSSAAFTSAGALVGAGALAGASTAAFTTTGALLGAGAVAGTATVTFTASATAAVGGAIAGTSTVAFSPTATIRGTGILAGTSSPAFTPSATIRGTGALAGISSAAFTLAGTLSGASPGAIAGTSSFTFTTSATGSLRAALTGSISCAFTVSGTATQPVTTITITSGNWNEQRTATGGVRAPAFTITSGDWDEERIT